MIDDDDDDVFGGFTLPTFHGGKDRLAASRMLQVVGGQPFRTRRLVRNGRTVLLRTRGGTPEFVTSEDQVLIPEIVADLVEIDYDAREYWAEALVSVAGYLSVGWYPIKKVILQRTGTPHTETWNFRQPT